MIYVFMCFSLLVLFFFLFAVNGKVETSCIQKWTDDLCYLHKAKLNPNFVCAHNYILFA